MYPENHQHFRQKLLPNAHIINECFLINNTFLLVHFHIVCVGVFVCVGMLLLYVYVVNNFLVGFPCELKTFVCSVQCVLMCDVFCVECVNVMCVCFLCVILYAKNLCVCVYVCVCVCVCV